MFSVLKLGPLFWKLTFICVLIFSHSTEGHSALWDFTNPWCNPTRCILLMSFTLSHQHHLTPNSHATHRSEGAIYSNQLTYQLAHLWDVGWEPRHLGEPKLSQGECTDSTLTTPKGQSRTILSSTLWQQCWLLPLPCLTIEVCMYNRHERFALWVILDFSSFCQHHFILLSTPASSRRL